jgi:hypothetical protein
MGQKLTSSRESSMSVLPLEADIHQGDGYVSFVPNSEVTGYHFAFSTRYAAERFFPDRQREAQLLPNITQRGCA